MTDKRMQPAWDPIALAAQLRNIAKQSQLVMRGFVSHQPNAIRFGMGGTSTLGFDFFELMTRMMADPLAAATAQIDLFYDTLVLLSQSVAALVDRNHIIEKTHFSAWGG
jgi:polyhydroxyalkanoate synthase subunit PhaC